MIREQFPRKNLGKLKIRLKVNPEYMDFKITQRSLRVFDNDSSFIA